MATIYIYDSTDFDKQSLASLSEGNNLQFMDSELTSANVRADAEVISVFVSSNVTAELLAKMPNLKMIACRSTGFNNIDSETVKQRGIVVSTVPTYGEHTVAEYAIGMMLSLTRRIPSAKEQLDSGVVNHQLLAGMDVYGKTMGVVGAGRIGKNVIKIASALGMHVLAFDPFPNEAAARELGFQFVDLDTLLKSSDVISLHAPATKENIHLLNKEKFAIMKKGAYVINTARGELIDSTALVEALQTRKVAGAALDVIEDEKLMEPDEEALILCYGRNCENSLRNLVAIDILEKMPNVILTSHNAYNTLEAIQRINDTTADNIKSYLNGEPKNQAKI